MRKRLIIAIDGPAGSGKSSTSKAFAKVLNIPYIDTGAMYRALTLKVMILNIPFKNVGQIVSLFKKTKIFLEGRDPLKQRVFLDGKDVTKAIREPELTKNVFHIAQEAPIRREMVKRQRRIGKAEGAVMEGRDIGTVVFPKADYKFYFEAKPKVRAKRRQRDLLAAGKKVSIAEVMKDIKKRDKTDIERKEGALRPAKDAMILDTSELTIPETIDKMIALMKPSHVRAVNS